MKSKTIKTVGEWIGDLEGIDRLASGNAWFDMETYHPVLGSCSGTGRLLNCCGEVILEFPSVRGKYSLFLVRDNSGKYPVLRIVHTC